MGAKSTKVKEVAKTTDEIAGDVVNKSTPVIALTGQAGAAFAATQTQNRIIDHGIDTATEYVENKLGLEYKQRDPSLTATSTLAHTAYNPLVAHITIPGKIAYNVARDAKEQRYTDTSGGQVSKYSLAQKISFVVLLTVLIIILLIIIIVLYIKNTVGDIVG